jgi:hypothetical protein
VLFPVNPGTLATYRDAFTPNHATDDPTDAARQLELWLKPRDTLPPLAPQSAARRALEPLVEPRRPLVGDNVRLTHRLTRTRKNDFPHVLAWCDDQDTTLCGDCLAPWPPLNAAPLARRAPRERFFHAPPGRDTNVIDQRLHAIKHATPLTPAAGVIAPQARFVQALMAQLRAILPAMADFDQALAPRAQEPPDCPVCAALPGAGAVFAPRLRVAFGAPRAR